MLQILIIEDDESFLQLLKLRLKSFMPEMEITNFDNLTDAKKFLAGDQKTNFDLVILDEHLPDGRGTEILGEGWFKDLAVLMLSSDTAPEIPGASLQAGAMYFLQKIQVKEPLFQPLVKGIIDRNKLQQELNEARTKTIISATVRTLVATLRHEINNPLGAVLGGAHLVQSGEQTTPEQIEAAKLIETSGKRIKYVLDELCAAVEVEEVTKASQKVFHVPGDKPWEEGK